VDGECQKRSYLRQRNGAGDAGSGIGWLSGGTTTLNCRTGTTHESPRDISPFPTGKGHRTVRVEQAVTWAALFEGQFVGRRQRKW
jgi:hypothetical protein